MKELNRLFTGTGNKGGVGKSFISIMLADYVIRTFGLERLSIGDAEISDIQRTFYTTMTRCGLIQPDAVKIWEMGNDRQFDRFLDDCSREDGRICVVDTGASMMEILNRQIGSISGILDEVNLEFNVVFVAGSSEDSERAAKSFLLSLAQAKNVKAHFVLMDPADYMTMENYAIFRTGLAKAIGKAGIPIHYIGKVPDCVFSQIMGEDRLPPCKLIERYEDQRFARSRICRWLNDVSDPIMRRIIGEANEAAG